MAKKMQRFNPHQLNSISDPKKTDILAPPIPLTPERYISKTLCALNFGVIEEWESTAPFLAGKTTEEWTFAVPSMATLSTEEWANDLISVFLVVENWQFVSITSTLLTTEGWG